MGIGFQFQQRAMVQIEGLVQDVFRHADGRGGGMAEAAGMPVWLQVAGLQLGVSGAYGNHVHAVIRNATIPSDVLHFTRENDLVGGVMAPKDGFVEIPETPGLGVELDMKALEHYRV